jgi:phage terminase Nu1 subunit (DNA packaging protein)
METYCACYVLLKSRSFFNVLQYCNSANTLEVKRSRLSGMCVLKIIHIQRKAFGTASRNSQSLKNTKIETERLKGKYVVVLKYEVEQVHRKILNLIPVVCKKYRKKYQKKSYM